MSSSVTDSTPRPLADFPAAELAAVEGVFADIDETLTTEGRLTAEAYGALERLHEAGLLVVPVTGRPAGWCDHIARMWPVDAVVGENGAFYFRYDRAAHKLVKRFLADAAERRANRRRLAALEREILAAVPGAGLASDQPYREADLAIDFCEDVDPLPREKVDEIIACFEAAGATAKVSSIHVNGWFGNYDKLFMTRISAGRGLRRRPGAGQRALCLRRRFAQRRAPVRLFPQRGRRRQRDGFRGPHGGLAGLCHAEARRRRIRRAGRRHSRGALVKGCFGSRPGHDIGLREVVTLEQERPIGRLG